MPSWKYLYHAAWMMAIDIAVFGVTKAPFLLGANRRRMLPGFARCCCAARQRGAHRWLAQSTRLASAAGPANNSLQEVAQQDAATHATPTPPSRPLKVAIVGRPNVGKSTLFNRLTGGKGKGWSGGSALVTPIPGTTRDRKDGRCSWEGIDMMVTDTGGLEEDEMMAKAPGDMRSLVNSQVTEAVKDSDVVVFLVDARAGVGPEDAHFARWIHKLGVKDKTVLVANKAEGGVLSLSMQTAVSEAYGLSLGDPIAISAEHNEGVSDLTSALVEAAVAAGFTPRTDDEDEVKEDLITLALVGLPNVGKSSLLNATLGQERVITSEVPGTTRDTVLVDYEWRGRRVRLVDTAGIRKWGKRDYTNKLETLSVEEAIRAIRYAHVVVLVLDAELLQLRRQELALANLAFSEGRCMVVAVNKSDLMVTRQTQLQEGVREQLKQLAPQLSTTDVVPTSCVTGQGIQRLLPAVARVYDAWNKRVNTGLLNRWFMDMTKIQPPKPQKGRKVKLKYITQVKARPPTFSLSTNVPEVEESYLRFLKKRLQEDFGLHGMDVRVNTRCTSTGNPYRDKTREKWKKIRAARASRVSKRPAEEQAQQQARKNRAKKVWPSKQEVREERQIKAKRDEKKRRRAPGLGARGASKLRSKL